MCKSTTYILCSVVFCIGLASANLFFQKNGPPVLDNTSNNVVKPQIQQVVPENNGTQSTISNYSPNVNTPNNYDANFNKNDTSNNVYDNLNNTVDQPAQNNNNESVNQTQDSSDNTEDESSEENDNELMYYLTQYRNRARRTIEGHLCAAAFVQRDQIYTDCTVEVAPDGTEGSKEWCYLEAQLTGKLEKDWGFCETPLNYEEIRSATLNHIQQKVSQVDELLKSLNTYRKLIKESERRLSTVCGMGHRFISDSLSKIETVLEESEKRIDDVNKLKNEIERIKNEIKKIQCVHNEVRKSQSTKYYPDNDIYNVSDGLVGTYYSNNVFEFPAVANRVDPQINFSFVNKMPILGLSPYKFSIRWEGYLKVPHSGNFVFELSTDAHGRVELNGTEIINTGIMFEGDDEIGYRFWVDPLMAKKEVSQAQQLIGGKFYKIKVEMSHSQQYKYDKGSESYFKLLWSSRRIDKQVIPSTNFYSKFKKTHTSISRLPASNFEIVNSFNGESAFRGSNSVFVANLSNGLIGSQLIRSDEKYNMGSFKMNVNQDSMLYVGYKKGQPFPLNPKDEQQWIEEETLESFDMYSAEALSENKVLSALNKIFKNDKESVLIETELKQIPLVRGVTYKFVTTNPDVSFVLFLSDNINSKQNQCIGSEVLVSLPGGSHFMSCSESSAHSREYDCNAALSGKYMDKKKSVWRTSGGTGESISIIFREPVLVTEFKFRPRDSSYTWPSKITLSYKEGGSETFNIFHSNDLEHHSYRVSVPKITTSVKVTIDEMYVSGPETGGSFGILGIPCKFSENLRFVEIMKCSESLVDLQNIYTFKNNDKFLAECQQECLVKSRVYVRDFNASEDQRFNETDPICGCAVSNDYCHEDSGSCVVEVQVVVNNGTGYLLRKSHHKQKKRMKKVQILFRKQPDKTPTQGYLIDNGQVKSDLDNLSYGWFREAHGQFCSSNDNPLYGGGIQFPPPTESLDCVQKEKCSGNYWSIELPENGDYKLEVILGSVCKLNHDFEAYLEVNGMPLVNGEVFKRDQFYTLVKNVTVKNKRIKLTSTCKNDQCPENGTIIQMVSVEQLV
ncbi:uncharacterized protein TOT_040000304 [Theileria orientalis strain Shintoku]|uniref:PA14 domain-containing protein n=1 Tax=Theileria orientalis strain Shintoku TaxID=869250 RepID=J4DQ67_THEOR|nr:uncharacterized protein TOT_040000304 [Theileria orientalis strain Shintoku]BAM41924.1 uncharacterized protein TOT_040000304 [Theileria orientalis strain Shintoku]|eukprot:XP_009692225.1 uncharacterized protein TOT_040000304 [Theileria orientalis strain Shintoku]